MLELKARMPAFEYQQNLLITFQVFREVEQTQRDDTDAKRENVAGASYDPVDTIIFFTGDKRDRPNMKTMTRTAPSSDSLFHRTFRDTRDWQLARAESLAG